MLRKAEHSTAQRGLLIVACLAILVPASHLKLKVLPVK